MEWMTGTDANEVDIGFTSLLRVSSMQPSSVWLPGGEVPLTSERIDLESFTWKQEIPLSVAQGILERTMYHFKQVRRLKVIHGYQCNRVIDGSNASIHSIVIDHIKQIDKLLEGYKTALNNN